MNAAALIEDLRSRGAIVEVAGNRLRVNAPKGMLTPELRLVLANRKPEIIALLSVKDAEVAWRVEAMLPQVPETGAIPFLVARYDVEPQAGCCLSCGDPDRGVNTFRCAACVRAASLALERALTSAKPTTEPQERTN